MRYLLIICTLYLVTCGQPGGIVNTEKPDADSVSLYISGTYLTVSNSVLELQLPCIIENDSLEKLPAVDLKERDCYELLPGEFDYEAYSSVRCIAKSFVHNGVPVLWFRLVSPGDYEESPSNVDIMMVLYDTDGRPYDVYNAASSSLAWKYSWVTIDSIFSVQVDEMENINVELVTIDIIDEGFNVTRTENSTFSGKDSAYVQSRRFISDFLEMHKNQTAKP